MLWHLAIPTTPEASLFQHSVVLPCVTEHHLLTRLLTDQESILSVHPHHEPCCHRHLTHASYPTWDPLDLVGRASWLWAKPLPAFVNKVFSLLTDYIASKSTFRFQQQSNRSNGDRRAHSLPGPSQRKLFPPQTSSNTDCYISKVPVPDAHSTWLGPQKRAHLTSNMRRSSKYLTIPLNVGEVGESGGWGGGG